MESKLNKKEMEIQLGISETNKIKESLFQLKKFFYGDFKYNEELGRDPKPNQLIQEAILCLECVIKEAKKIEINSV